jgi:ATP-dependent DNA helicase RecG
MERFASSNRESRVEEYPFDAMRQLVRNALMHRSYEATNAPVRVYWFDDRIEIHNPGGPYGTVTVDNFGEPGLTDYRNPNLAEALRALGFVQRFGAGIAIARKVLGTRLRFETQPGFVAAIVNKETR